MKLAIHQMTSGIDPLKNAEIMSEAIAESAARGARFYFAPEMSLLLDRDRSRAARHIVPQEENIPIARVTKLAQEYGIWIHIGSIPVAGIDSKTANRSLIINDHGMIVAAYDKIHLFDVDLATGESWRESSAYRAGTESQIVDTPLGPLGLAICYDMRFPELFARLTKAGIQALAIPSAFTVPTGKAHWHTLLRARAIESAAFVIAAAQSGKHDDGRETYGHSLVIDPWGDVLLDMGKEEGLGFVEIDLARVQEVRRQIPVHLNRRDIPAPL
ncbi:MAG: carbon-nitrogen hydrolase family protein [Sphingorhabdus sp.]